MLGEDGIVVKVSCVLEYAFDSCSALKEAMITAAILRAKENGGFGCTTPLTMCPHFLLLRSVHLI